MPQFGRAPLTFFDALGLSLVLTVMASFIYGVTRGCISLVKPSGTAKAEPRRSDHSLYDPEIDGATELGELVEKPAQA